MNFNAPRYRKYPAAEMAVRGYLTIEYTTGRVGPAALKTNWPVYLNELFGDEHSPQYSRSQTNEKNLFIPSRHEIDNACEWLQYSLWMLQPGRDKRSWEMFVAYAHGVSVLNIADHHNISRKYASNLLDSIFYQIQVEAEIRAMRGKAI